VLHDSSRRFDVLHEMGRWSRQLNSTRVFIDHTSEDKARIVKEADACAGAGEVGALLRREGI